MTTLAKSRESIEARLGRWVDRRAPNECWPWKGGTVPGGYGLMKVCGRQRVAHCVAYETWVGPIPEGKILLHSCDNPPCCNPSHLSPGTTKSNSDDAYAKGRLMHGDGSYQAKLTDAAVAKIRADYAAGKATLKAFAALHGTSQRAVWNAVHRVTWRHVA